MAEPCTGGRHTFHIPVMGTGFSIDTPLSVARYGITSTISLADDVLIEQMRGLHCARSGAPYTFIDGRSPDARARRITAYLDLLHDLVQRQVEALRSAPFEPSSEITRYFELLPDGALRTAYKRMLACTDAAQRAAAQAALRRGVTPGGIDVNIMTKLARTPRHAGQPLPPEFADGMAALRGYAQSKLDSAIIFSAGMNPRLYSYIAAFDDFFPDAAGAFRKRIVLKVSDFRSAQVQGKYLAKRGLWVSEYRIESGLNCGGHAFATKGLLLGPILEEFRTHREALRAELFGVFQTALADAGRTPVSAPPPVRVTAQGGIGTADEDGFLRAQYALDGTGWGTPFLLVPEATNVDDAHLEKLASAGPDDVYLSAASPLGVPFWNLRTSASEEARSRRIMEGRPGSACPKGYLVTDTAFADEPICHAAHTYQRRRLAHLAEEGLSAAQLPVVAESVVAKACLCHDLAGGATLKHGIDPRATPAVCCGPNIVHFGRQATLDEMVGHIYGRCSLLVDAARPHVFIRELGLYIDHLGREIHQAALGLWDKAPSYVEEFKGNLLAGIDSYRALAGALLDEQRERFRRDLDHLRQRLLSLSPACVT